MSSHWDQEEVAVTRRGTTSLSTPLLNSSPPSEKPALSTDWQEEAMSEEYKLDSNTASLFNVPDTFNLPTYNVLQTSLQENVAFASNSLNLIHFPQFLNISSLCGSSWHPCVRSKPLSPVLSALSVAVSCSHQRVQTHGVKPSSRRNVL